MKYDGNVKIMEDNKSEMMRKLEGLTAGHGGSNFGNGRDA